jgi:uncharacterized membrane protein YkgB
MHLQKYFGKIRLSIFIVLSWLGSLNLYLYDYVRRIQDTVKLMNIGFLSILQIWNNAS